jgi:hypothetical protein
MKTVLLLSTLVFLGYGSSASPAADKKQRCDLQTKPGVGCSCPAASRFRTSGADSGMPG